MNKQALLQQLSNCQEVINDEVSLLEQWENAPGITAGRAAQCDAAITYIQSGLTSPAALIQNILDQANSIADSAILKDPTPAHLSLLAQCQASIATRSTWNGPGLSPSMFENAIGMAQENSQQTADCAASIFQDSTG